MILTVPQLEQPSMLTLNLLRVLLPHLMLRSIQMPLVGPPPICVKLRDAKCGLFAPHLEKVYSRNDVMQTD